MSVEESVTKHPSGLTGVLDGDDDLISSGELDYDRDQEEKQRRKAESIATLLDSDECEVFSAEDLEQLDDDYLYEWACSVRQKEKNIDDGLEDGYEKGVEIKLSSEVHSMRNYTDNIVETKRVVKGDDLYLRRVYNSYKTGKKEPYHIDQLIRSDRVWFQGRCLMKHRVVHYMKHGTWPAYRHPGRKPKEHPLIHKAQIRSWGDSVYLGSYATEKERDEVVNKFRTWEKSNPARIRSQGKSLCTT